MRSDSNSMIFKGDGVLFLDKELITKSKELGFNLSKTYEIRLKQLMLRFSRSNSVNNFNFSENHVQMVGLPGFEPGSIELSGINLVDWEERFLNACFICI
jgi:hypothetical protein